MKAEFDARTVQTTRRWVLGILGAAALAILAVSVVLTPEALAEAQPLAALGIDTPACPGCPLCGMSRAFAAMSRAQFARALEFNVGVVVAYPLTVTLALVGPWIWLRGWLERSLPWPSSR